jgi:outer membrane protein OmpA-like peptidoglycan-associated protein
MRSLGLALVVALCSWALPVAGQVDAEASAATTLAGPEADSAMRHWWLGAYFRHLEVPPYMTEPFFDRAPSVSNNGFGLVATYRTGGGLNFLMGIGYMPYEFSGPFRADNEPAVDTELVRSDLEFFHVVGALLWDIEFHQVVALEIGLGLDVGVLAGDIRRNEAFLQSDGTFRDCEGPLNPPVMPVGATKPYCALPENGSGLTGTDDPEDEGEHYNVTEERVPPLMLFPAIPQVGLRIQPFKYLAIKLEGAFGIVQWWVGASLHASFGLFEKGPSEVFVQAEPEVANGRVLGKVVEADTGVPIAGAIVRQSVRAMSPLSTESDGRFVIDRLDPGTVTFEIEHADYAKGRCEVDIPQAGGDVAVQCRLTAKARVGAMSGQVQDERGEAVGSATIELTGPHEEKLTSDARGLFAAVDLPAGTYRMRVLAEGYLVQVIEIEVEPHETAMPQIILIKKPERSLVQLKKEEIVIAEQVQFKSGSSVIMAESNDLLSQVADVLLRHTQIERVEVQGHTDSTGGRDMNMKLSQARADAVRDWLVEHGVGAERLEGKGYGPDHPIRPNDTPANRQKNRRVQFIIRQQSAEVSD